MGGNPINLTRFWQELKRRRVFRVVTTYAATAYIIIEVTNNVVGPLHLPEWTATLVIFLLALGLPVVVILAWVFDFTPEGIKKTESITIARQEKIITKHVKKGLRTNDIVIAVLIVIVAVLAWPKIFKHDKPENLIFSDETISVAVMPFQNMTNDTIWNDWQDGIQVNLITSLSNSEELKVKQMESVNRLLQIRGLTNYASLTPSIASTISQTLDANVFVLLFQLSQRREGLLSDPLMKIFIVLYIEESVQLISPLTLSDYDDQIPALSISVIHFPSLETKIGIVTFCIYIKKIEEIILFWPRDIL